MFRSGPRDCQREAGNSRLFLYPIVGLWVKHNARITFGPDTMTAIPSDKLVTIFGGSGFLGRHIIRALANDGWRIRAAVRKPNTANFLLPMGRVGQIQLLKTNVRDDNAVEAAL